MDGIRLFWDAVVDNYYPRILIIEDDVCVCGLFERVLAEDGYVVTTAITGRQAIARLEDAAFDVIVEDLSLPDRDGLGLLHEIHAEYPWIKILAISGYMVGRTQDLALAAGASATLFKPVRPEALRHGVYGLFDPAEKWRGRGARPATAD